MKDLFSFLRKNLFVTGIWSVALIFSLVGAGCFVKAMIESPKSTLMTLAGLLPILALGLVMAFAMVRAIYKEKRK